MRSIDGRMQLILPTLKNRVFQTFTSLKFELPGHFKIRSLQTRPTDYFHRSLFFCMVYVSVPVATTGSFGVKVHINACRMYDETV
jgi:hypothetical protein